MALHGRIQSIFIDPVILNSQARKLSFLQNDYSMVFDIIRSELRKVNNNWSVKLENNFTSKIFSANQILETISAALGIGAQAALHGVTSFEDLDTYLSNAYHHETEQVSSQGQNWNATSIGDAYTEASQAFDDYINGNNSGNNTYATGVETRVPDYENIVLRGANGELNLEAFWQNNPEYQTFKSDYSGELNQQTGMAAGGCNLCSTAYVLSNMGHDIDPISLYYKAGGYCDTGAVAGIIGASGPTYGSTADELNRFIEESLENPSKYSMPVIRCYNQLTEEHYMAIKDYVKDKEGNIVDYTIMDPATGKEISYYHGFQQGIYPGEISIGADGAPIILSFVRYVAG